MEGFVAVVRIRPGVVADLSSVQGGSAGIAEERVIAPEAGAREITMVTARHAATLTAAATAGFGVGADPAGVVDDPHPVDECPDGASTGIIRAGEVV